MLLVLMLAFFGSREVLAGMVNTCGKQ